MSETHKKNIIMKGNKIIFQIIYFSTQYSNNHQQQMKLIITTHNKSLSYTHGWRFSYYVTYLNVDHKKIVILMEKKTFFFNLVNDFMLMESWFGYWI